MADQYIVSARKYRPDTFASIVGQGAMSSTLRTAVLQGRLAHAYLFCGPRGVGKTTAARVLAKTINCLALSSDGEACNECESCRAFNEQRSFNVFELDAASNNSVDDMRGLIEQVASPPIHGRYSVYIIDEVHMLSSAAFNAFLKTLEEPPAYAIFILATTEKHKVLPTILSRCQIYDFHRITLMDIVRHLAYVATSEGIVAEEPALALIAEKADGGMRDALSMLDRVASYAQGHITYAHALECLNMLDYSYYVRIVDTLLRGDYQGLLLLLDELLAKGFDGQLIIGGLASFMRDLLVVQHPDTARLLEKPESVAQLYLQTAQRIAPAGLHQCLKLLVACDQQYRSATNKRLLVELTLLNLLSALAPSALAQQATTSTPLPASQPTSPTPSPAPRPQPVATPQPPVATPTPQPAATPQPVATPPSAQPPVATPSVQPAPQPTTSPQAYLGQESSIKRTRENFRALQSRAQQQRQDSPTQQTEVREELHEPFDEQRMQQAWMTFIDRELEEEQIIARKLMTQSIPKLISPHMAEVGIANTSALIDPVASVLPRAEAFMRHMLRNTDLSVRIRPLEASEVRRIPITSQERYQAMAEHNPMLHQLRNRLGLRII